MGLRVLLPGLASALRDAGTDREHAGGQVEPVPGDRAQLAAASAGHHGEPDEHPPVRALPCLVDDAGGLFRGRRVRFAPAGCGRFGLLDRVGADPAPSDGPLEGSAQDAVNLPDRRSGERPADVRPTAAIADVLLGGSVVYRGPPTAVSATCAQLRVERVQDLTVDLANAERSQQGPDVVLDVALVAAEGGPVNVEQLEVPVHELVDGGPSARVAALVDLRQQPRPRLLGL